jgi:hypothetical protein
MAKASFTWCLVFAVIIQAQESVPIGGRSKRAVTVVIDSAEIRKLIGEEEKRRDEADRFFRENHSGDEKTSAHRKSHNASGPDAARTQGVSGGDGKGSRCDCFGKNARSGAGDFEGAVYA